MPKGFFPQQDTGRLQGIVMGDQDVSFDAMKNKMDEYISIVQQDPAVRTCLGLSGRRRRSKPGAHLRDPEALKYRKVVTADKVITRLRPKLAHVPGATVYFQAYQELQIGGRLGNAQYQYTLSGEDLGELYKWAPMLTDKLKAIPQLKDVNSDQQVSGLEQNVVIDRDTAARLGITPSQIDNVLYDAFGQTRDLDHLPDAEPVLRGARSRSAVPDDPVRAGKCICYYLRRSAGAAVGVRAF